MCPRIGNLCNRWSFCATLLGLALLIIVPTIFHSDVNSEEEWVYPPAKISNGAIVSNGGPCAEIGMKILKKYGNAIDSLIATMVCDGAIIFHKMGLGGGFLATMYIKSKGEVDFINAREVAPRASHEDMFMINSVQSKYGGLAIAVPGELSGYWAMYKKYGGSTPWEELFKETIKLCEEGVPISEQLETIFVAHKEKILKSPMLRKMLLNEKGKLPRKGDKLKRVQLAKTLKTISLHGPSSFYNGSLSKGIVKDIKNAGGIITLEDLVNYRPRWETPLSTTLSTGHHLYYGRPPSSGLVLAYIIKLLDGLIPRANESPETTSIITEAFKFGYALRSHLGDDQFTNSSDTEKTVFLEEHLNHIRKKLLVTKTSNDYRYYGGVYEFEDHGTANIVVYGPNGDVVSATSSLNLFFGGGVVSESTGIIFNNHMDDFSTTSLINSFGVPPSRNNFISPGKRPMSSMCPIIVLDREGVPCLAIGAAGGTKILSAVALVTMRKLWQNLPMTEAVKKSRFHHQLLPMVWEYEKSLPKLIVKEMEERGHKTSRLGIATISAIYKNGPYLEASADHRRGGNTSYLVDFEQ